MRRVLVTGASGFIGVAVLERLRLGQYGAPRAAVRRAIANPVGDVEYVQVADAGPDSDWQKAVRGVDVIVHAAARVHASGARSRDYLRVNTLGTLNLARQAADAGVRRFVFLSSIKVNGESTMPGCPYTADDEARPVDLYGISKHRAEQELFELSRMAGIEVVCIRPPLVYGPGVKANFLALLRWVNSGIPVPLGAVRNSRSLLALDNLVGLITKCIDHPGAANQVFLAADSEDLSTGDLVRRIGLALRRPVRLYSVPPDILRAIGALMGRSRQMSRLCDSLQIDTSKARDVLGWSPEISVERALQKTATQFLDSLKS